MRCILLKYGELILKGLNRNYFEKLLLNQIRNRLRPLGKFEVATPPYSFQNEDAPFLRIKTLKIKQRLKRFPVI